MNCSAPRRNCSTKYFEPADKPGHLRVVERLRSRVFFQYHDLLSLKPVGVDYCLIVCKNVMLHFQYPERVEVFRMFHQALAPGGYLANENTQKLPAGGGAPLHPGGSGCPALQEGWGLMP